MLHIIQNTYEATYMIAISMGNTFQCNLHIETISISIAKMDSLSFHVLPSSLIMILGQSNRDSCMANCILRLFDRFPMWTIMCNVFDTWLFLLEQDFELISNYINYIYYIWLTIFGNYWITIVRDLKIWKIVPRISEKITIVIFIIKKIIYLK